MAVVFDEPELVKAGRKPTPKGPSFLTRLVLKTGIVKDERGAQIVLLVVGVVALALAAWLIIDSMPQYEPLPGDPTAL